MVVVLYKKFLLNTGTNRACYIYPKDEKVCVKIDISKNTKETKRELRYYKFLEKKKISYDMLAKYYGSIVTNLGQGEMFELIRDFDGSISLELAKYLETDLNMQQRDEVKQLILELQMYIKKYSIYVKDLNSVNVMVQKIDAKSKRLVIVDGLAHSWYISLFCSLSNNFLRGKIDESWERFVKMVYDTIAS